MLISLVAIVVQWLFEFKISQGSVAT